MKYLIDYSETPQATGLEYDEMRDLEKNPEKQGKYNKLIKERTKLGKDFETKAPEKKKRRSRKSA